MKMARMAFHDEVGHKLNAGQFLFSGDDKSY